MRIFLLGAGVNMDAGMPDSAELLKQVHAASSGKDWEMCRPLHTEIYQAITRDPGEGASVLDVRMPDGHDDPNIQTYVDALRAIGDPPAEDLRRLVMREISRLLHPKCLEKAGYFRGFTRLGERTGEPVEIFTLNYDTSLERVLGDDVMTGFSGHGKKHTWNPVCFRLPRLGRVINLYKMHGSLNWHTNAAGEIYESDPRGPFDGEMPVIVLGYEEKENKRYPYSYWDCVEEFGYASIRADEIAAIGYGFGDDDINGMLRKALRRGNIKKLWVVVGEFTDEGRRRAREEHIRKKLDHSGKVTVLNTTAKKFLDGL